MGQYGASFGPLAHAFQVLIPGEHPESGVMERAEAGAG
jgi:DNA-binding helix-hairpin-helix protein with protein kinase domain